MRQMTHHEEHGRQRLPDVAQPALAGDDRGLPGARHRDDGRGLRHLAHAASASSTTGASSTPTERLRHQGDGQRGEELAGRRSCGRSATRSPTRRRPPPACRSPSAWSPTSRRSTPRARSSSARTSTAASRATGSGAELILGQLDGLGLNYNTAASVDALHAKYPNTFLFESESSSETSTRGVYQDPDLLNTGENYTPGKRGDVLLRQQPRLLDDERRVRPEEGPRPQVLRRPVPVVGLRLHRRADAVRRLPGQVLVLRRRSTPRASPRTPTSCSAASGRRTRWSTCVPMNWTDHEPGETVQVWAYANVDTVELFLNGHSLGVKTLRPQDDGRRRGPTSRRPRRPATTRTSPSGPYPGSYTSPNGSAGKLHLTWNVPFAPGKLVAVASRDGHEVARDEVDTAGPPAAVRLTPDKRTIAADGTLAVLRHGRRRRRPRRDRPGRRQRDLLRRQRRRARSSGSTTAARRTPRTTRPPRARRSTARRWPSSPPATVPGRSR